MENISLVEQISSFKSLPKEDIKWRVAFYNIAKALWQSEELFVVLDKESFEMGFNLPLIREYKKTLAVQFFTDYNKALAFTEKNGNDFIFNDKILICKVKKNAFQSVFAPFYAKQNLAYMINDLEEHFVDTFERLIAVMEADSDYIVDENQLKMANKGDLKGVYCDFCNKYLIPLY